MSGASAISEKAYGATRAQQKRAGEGSLGLVLYSREEQGLPRGGADCLPSKIVGRCYCTLQESPPCPVASLYEDNLGSAGPVQPGARPAASREYLAGGRSRR